MNREERHFLEDIVFAYLVGECDYGLEQEARLTI